MTGTKFRIGDVVVVTALFGTITAINDDDGFPIYEVDAGCQESVVVFQDEFRLATEVEREKYIT